MIPTSFFSCAFLLGSNFHNLYSQASWNSCCGKKNAAMKYGCGDQNERFASWISFMFGVASIPYCWAAKSIAKERGATQRAVEWVIPIFGGLMVDLGD